MKKVPISFNDDDLKNVEELTDLMGIRGTYGDFPKAVKFGINLALSCLKDPQKVYSRLEEPELNIFFSSIKKVEIRKRLADKAENLSKQA